LFWLSALVRRLEATNCCVPVRGLEVELEGQVILFGLRIYYVMSADFKLCINCDKLVNILDDHDDCYRHRVCNSEFPCEICKSWTSEKRQSVERMIDKARLAATKKQSRSTDVETCPSSSTSSPLTGTRQFVASSLLTKADNQNNLSLLTGTVTTQSPLTGTGAKRVGLRAS
jgi:hypothetical protein